MNMKASFRIDVFSIFPKLIDEFCSESLLGRAREESLVDLRCHDLRDYGDESRRVDDALYGGGAGMLFRPEPIFKAVEAVQPQRPMFLLSPGGKRFDQEFADKLSKTSGFSLLCGRYEGVDHRVVEHLIDGEISIGDVVLSGGEVASVRKFWRLANA
jgi:tRNA (guanine37-N1)-methyltransferase